MLPLGFCPGFDVSGVKGRLELEGYWCRVWRDGAQGGVEFLGVI